MHSIPPLFRPLPCFTTFFTSFSLLVRHAPTAKRSLETGSAFDATTIVKGVTPGAHPPTRKEAPDSEAFSVHRVTTKPTTDREWAAVTREAMLRGRPEV